MTSKAETQLLRALFDIAVEAADPMLTIPRYLPKKPKGRVVVVGAGKASARMAEAVEHQWGPCEGLVITRYGYARACKGIEIIEAAHPVSDMAGMAATSRMLDLLEDLGENDFVLSLISGGGSALLCAPAGEMSLKDKQQVHRSLLKSGAPISKMNIVRKHLSGVKGGQLAATAYPASMLSLLISDVPGDNPADIASGATVGELSSNDDAMGIARTYNIDLPDTAKSVLMGPEHVILPSDERLSRVENIIISAPSQSLEAVRTASEKQGITVMNLGDAIEGEARDEGRRQAEIALKLQGEMRANQPPILLLSGGECTVSGNGGGVGGPNAEFALSCAIALDGAAQIYLIACDTDGVDGAAEVAGAIVTPDTLGKAKSVDADAEKALQNNDSHNFFARIGDQVITGPTLTNVNDFRAILIKPLRP